MKKMKIIVVNIPKKKRKMIMNYKKKFLLENRLLPKIKILSYTPLKNQKNMNNSNSSFISCNTSYFNKSIESDIQDACHIAKEVLKFTL